MSSLTFVILATLSAFFAGPDGGILKTALASTPTHSSAFRFIQIEANHKVQRSEIANMGISIENVLSDSVWAFANQSQIKKLREAHFKILGEFDFQVARGGHSGIFDFPSSDLAFHNYERLEKALRELVSQNPDLASLQSIGKSVEGRTLWALHINSTPEALQSGNSNKPGAIFLGNHHAREHLSVEVPLLLAQYLLEHRAETKINRLLTTRDIWIVPMVNPDGAEFDVAKGRYQWWRKNRSKNGDGTFGVDLNRNYGYKWGAGGSSKDPSSEIFMGKDPFSEPETQAVRDFVNAHLNAKILLSFHTFSELILYPWGYTYNPVANQKDRDVFEKMSKTMADWNHYTPQQSSELYIASGDTTDWAYGEHNIFSFTFELSPSSMMGGGFYPGAQAIEKVFKANLQPSLYLIDMADDPYRSLETSTLPEWDVLGMSRGLE